MSKNTKKRKSKGKIYMIVIVLLVVLFGYEMYYYWPKISINNSDILKLNEEYNKLVKEEEILSSDIIKLQDPEYIARFAREKYLYSANGEIIIKIIE